MNGPAVRPRVHNRVLALLLLAAVPAVAGLAFVRVAPNRLLSGQPFTLWALLNDPAAPAATGWSLVLALPLAVWAGAALVPASRRVHAIVAVASAVLLALLCGLAGQEAMRLTAAQSSLARVSLGGGFWLLMLLGWLAAADALQRSALAPAARTLALAAVLSGPMVLLLVGQLDALSLLKEYENRREAFDAALWRHGQIVLSALLPALALGVPLGVAAAHSPRVARPLFASLNVIQTVPSIALFAVLIAPLAAIGLKGIGLLPAAIALTLYALLPIVHGAAAGLSAVPSPALEAGRGMGMTPRQLFWRVRVPLALPVLVAGVRVTTVQVIGLAVVAALIGAGGLGALVFQGLASAAIDLVMLGVVPVVALAVAVDAAFGVLAALLPRTGPLPAGAAP